MIYTLKKYGNSGEFNYIDQDGTSFNSPANWLWTGILGGCGCGSSDDLADKAVEVLKYFGTEHDKRDTKMLYENELNETLAHWMDSKGLLEHGSSIGGGWLTEKGKEILQATLTLS